MSKVVQQLLPWFVPLIEREVEGLGYSGDNGIGRLEGGQGHEMNALLKGVRLCRRGFQGQTRFADATRADQRQQPTLWVPKPLLPLIRSR